MSRFGAMLAVVGLMLVCGSGCGRSDAPVPVTEAVRADVERVSGELPAESVAELLTDQELGRLVLDIQDAIDGLHDQPAGTTVVSARHLYQFGLNPALDADGASHMVVTAGDVRGIQKSVYAVFIRNGSVVRAKHLRIGQLK